MKPKIFDIEEGKVILNDNFFRIPILKRLYETYGDEALDMCSVIDYFCDLEGVYNNYEEETKLEEIINDLEFTDRDYLLNPDFVEVLDWCKDKWILTEEKLYLDHKANIESLGSWSRTSIPTDGSNGNIQQKLAFAKEVRKLYQDLIAFEQEVKKNLRARGDSEIAYDQKR